MGILYVLPWTCLLVTLSMSDFHMAQDDIWRDKSHVSSDLLAEKNNANLNCLSVWVCVPLKAQTHFVGQSVQQQHCLPPSCVNLIPLHWDTGKSTQTEVVDGTKLAAVPAQQKKQTI